MVKSPNQSFGGTILCTLRKVLCPLTMRNDQVHNSCSNDPSIANSLISKMDGAFSLLLQIQCANTKVGVVEL